MKIADFSKVSGLIADLQRIDGYILMAREGSGVTLTFAGRYDDSFRPVILPVVLRELEGRRASVIDQLKHLGVEP